MEDFFNIVVQNGFSVAVAAFLLVKVDARIEELTKAVTQLVMLIDRLERRLCTNEPIHSKENTDDDKKQL